MTISICIPACNRVGLLEEALQSCLLSEFRDIELLIGDDSDDNENERLIARFARRIDIPVRYERNEPALGQSGNVNRLFDKARGERLILLHDDDLLCPKALDILDAVWRSARDPGCVYGRQLVIDVDGTLLDDRTRIWCDRYSRLPAFAGVQASGMLAAVRQQVSNNGYLIRTNVAREVRYRPESEVGQSVDAEFIVRLAASIRSEFIYIDADICKYRLTPLSIARRQGLNRREDLFFETIRNVQGDAEIEAAKAKLLSRISVGASIDAAMVGRRRFALSIIFSKQYGRPWLSHWTAYRLVCLFSPWLAARLRTLLRGRML